MKGTIIRIVLGVIWLIGGVVSLFQANYPMAAIYFAIGIIFLLTARRSKKNRDQQK